MRHQVYWYAGLALFALFAREGVVTRTVHAADETLAARSAIDQAYAEEIARLSTRCVELGMEHEAELTRQWLVPRFAGRDYVFVTHNVTPGSAAEPAGDVAEPPLTYWQKHFVAARRAQAERLFALARQEAATQPALAYRLLHEILREDPDHAQARRLLGYRRIGDQWRRAGDQIQSARGRTPRPEYGFAGRGYWQLATAHFQLTTDGDERQARLIAQRLEDVHSVWQQLFYDYWNDGASLGRRFEQGTSDYRPRTDRHRVVWFQTREQYLDALRPLEPRIDKTLGIYLDRQKTAYFYGDPEEMHTTWVHEITHQLFAESLRTAPGIAARHNLWIVEGIALYMESLRWQEGYATLGGYDADRLQYARYRALNDKFYVPLAEFTALGREAVQRDENIGALYSQAAGLTHFLMHTPHRRAATIKFLSLLYAGRDEPGTLAELTGETYGQLDRAYAEFLLVEDRQVVPGPPVVNLYLGHTAITDASLSRIALDKLEWLDVGYTAITDVGLAVLVRAPALRRLTLEHTAITAEAVESLAQLGQLEYLDLSGLPVTDEQLQAIGQLAELESLWLTDTRVSDAGLEALGGLKKLKTLDVAGTAVTSAGLAALRKQLPELEPR